VVGQAGAGDGDVGDSTKDPGKHAVADPEDSTGSTSKSPSVEDGAEDPETPAPGSTCGVEENSHPYTDWPSDAEERIGDIRISVCVHEGIRSSSYCSMSGTHASLNHCLLLNSSAPLPTSCIVLSQIFSVDSEEQTA
jgi:hypothetical protein